MRGLFRTMAIVGLAGALAGPALRPAAAETHPGYLLLAYLKITGQII
jgi:hypothetical protein